MHRGEDGGIGDAIRARTLTHMITCTTLAYMAPTYTTSSRLLLVALGVALVGCSGDKSDRRADLAPADTAQPTNHPDVAPPRDAGTDRDAINVGGGRDARVDADARIVRDARIDSDARVVHDARIDRDSAPVRDALPVSDSGPDAEPEGIVPEAIYEPPDGPTRIPIEITSSVPVQGPIPVTTGVPVHRTRCDPDRYTVVDGDGTPVPTQVRVNVISDFCWLLVDFQGDMAESYVLTEGLQPAPAAAVTVTPAAGGGYSVDTGAARFEIPFSTALIESALRAGEAAPALRDGRWNGAVRPLDPATDSIDIVDDGPMRAMIRVRARDAICGDARRIFDRERNSTAVDADSRDGCLDLVARMHFYAGRPYARLRLTLTNHARCYFDGLQPRCNDLDSENTVQFEDLTFGFDTGPVARTETLYQDSSGTDGWDYLRFLATNEPEVMNYRIQKDVHFRGYRRFAGGDLAAVLDEGDQADGVIRAGGVRYDVPYFAGNYPKALRADAATHRVDFGLFPAEFVRLGSEVQYRFRPGEQKTHDMWVSLDPDVAPPWPAFGFAAPAHYRDTHALGFLGLRTPDRFEPYETYLDRQFVPEPDETFHDNSCLVRGTYKDICEADPNRVRGDCCSMEHSADSFGHHGWMDFGDIGADFEAGTYPYNLKYDINLGFVQQFLRMYDAEPSMSHNFLHWARIGNVHFADIDVIHSRIRGVEARRGWWEGGACGHADHMAPGLIDPHRDSFNPAPDLYYGAVGMAAWALFTGDDMVREAALEMGENTLYRVWNSGLEGEARLPFGGTFQTEVCDDDGVCRIEDVEMQQGDVYYQNDCLWQAWRRDAPHGEYGDGYAISVGHYVVLGKGPANARALGNIVRLLTWIYKMTGEEHFLDGAAGGGRFFQCHKLAMSRCANWPSAYIARAIAEYVFATVDSGREPDPDAVVSVLDNLEAMSVQFVQDTPHRRLISNECRELPPLPGDVWFRGTLTNDWMLVVADAFALGYALTSDRSWLNDYALPGFNVGQEDPSYYDDPSHYHATKEAVNSIGLGATFLHFANAAIDRGVWADDRNSGYEMPPLPGSGGHDGGADSGVGPGPGPIGVVDTEIDMDEGSEVFDPGPGPAIDVTLALAERDYTYISDASIWGHAPDRIGNYGASHSLVMYEEHAGSNHWHTLVHFGLAFVPANAQIEQAELRLFARTEDPNLGVLPAATIGIHAVARSWVEGDCEFTDVGCIGSAAAGVTWLSRGPAHDLGLWTTPGGDVDAVEIAAAVPVVPGEWVSIDLTNIVRAWIAGERPNYGVMLNGVGAAFAVFYSSEAPEVELRPRLRLRYSNQ